MTLLTLIKTLTSLMILFYTVKMVVLIKSVISEARQNKKKKYMLECRKELEVKDESSK